MGFIADNLKREKLEKIEFAKRSPDLAAKYEQIDNITREYPSLRSTIEREVYREGLDKVIQKYSNICL